MGGQLPTSMTTPGAMQVLCPSLGDDEEDSEDDEEDSEDDEEDSEDDEEDSEDDE